MNAVKQRATRVQQQEASSSAPDSKREDPAIDQEKTWSMRTATMTTAKKKGEFDQGKAQVIFDD